ncbi:unnamed protein product [Anisakis simplex]|uniref:DNA-directed RNA polymerase n=1 Tax=Anisakis simplex TaxID=6269 RepID=A0A0M3JF15_ANISI|nr:unnamed protein product [Anisakis simplex]
MAFSTVESERREEDDESDRHKFERLVQEKIDLPTSDNGLYLARTVAPVLTKALAEVIQLNFSTFCTFQ